MEETTYGVNPDKIDELVLSLNNDIDSISTILNDIEINFYDMKDYFKGDVADAVQEKWEKYRASITTIKGNLQSYSDEMLNIKTLYGKIDTKASKEAEHYAEEEVEENKRIVNDNENKLQSIHINSGEINKGIKIDEKL